MKVDGKEFLRNIGIEEDKQNLKKEQERLEKQKRESIQKESGFFDNDPSDDDAISLNISSQNGSLNEKEFNNLYDIKLNPDNSGGNKKKYIILIASLILLFIITIVVIRVISNNKEENKIEQTNTQTLKQDNQLNKIKTNEEYEKIIKEDNEKLTFEKDEPQIEIQEKKELVLPEPIKEKPPVNIQTPKVEDVKNDLFGITDAASTDIKTEEPQTKEVIKKEEAKPEVKKTVNQEQLKDKLKESLKNAAVTQKQIALPVPEVTNFNVNDKKSEQIKGYFIQVGSFTKKPSDNYLNDIAKKGYTYKIHQVEVKGKTFNKLLIGTYPTHDAAKQNLEKVKKDLKAPGAYILKL